MKHLFFLTVLFSNFAFAEVTAIGRWKTIDDETHKPRSIVRIEEKDGKLEGFIEKKFEVPGDTGETLCKNCKGDLKDKPIIGLRFLWDLKKDKPGTYSGGEVLDPKNGKVYDCKIKVAEDGKTLKLRGFIGVSLLGRTQVWEREDAAAVSTPTSAPVSAPVKAE